ncbi:unnamed protein product [Staurois parvus]|uniref:Uncharacterized protein n=1 Tax=Staurois parvus TaxID=386267 RepID=A0ABN9BEL8_9NEOB|nr:unnamed protein product [Staurois parvus]
MPLVPFYRLFFGCALSVGKNTGAPLSPIAWGPHELSVRPCSEMCNTVLPLDLTM